MSNIKEGFTHTGSEVTNLLWLANSLNIYNMFMYKQGFFNIADKDVP